MSFKDSSSQLPLKSSMISSATNAYTGNKAKQTTFAPLSPKANKIVNISSQDEYIDHNINDSEYDHDEEHFDDENDKIVYESFLNWEAEGGISINFQQMLSQQSKDLNKEIIELLIQWEEQKFDNNSSPNKQKSSNDVLKSTSRPSNSNALKKKTKHTPLTLKKDVNIVVAALADLDKELEAVDAHLEKQIELFQDVNSKLASIESDSSTLEINWQNLSNVQYILSTIQSKLYLSEAHIKTLRNPETIFDSILKSTDIRDNEEKLKPLSASFDAISAAIQFKGYDEVIHNVTSNLSNNAYELSTAEWVTLSSKMKSIQSQKQYLIEIFDTFYDRMNSLVSGLFQSILKHKSIQDIIAVKTINFNELSRLLYFTTTACPVTYIDDTQDLAAGQSGILPRSNSSGHFDISYRMDNSNFNPFVAAQRVYHEILNDFLPIIENLFRMSSTHTASICIAYIVHSKEHLYTLLFKKLFKDVCTSIQYKRTYIGLSNTSDKEWVSVRLQSKETSPLSPWSALELLIVTVMPIIKREDLFVQSFFPTPDENEQSDALTNPLESLFDNLLGHFLKYISPSTTDIDGIENIGYLFTIEKFIQDQLNIGIDDEEKDRYTIDFTPLKSATYDSHILLLLKILLQLRSAVTKSLTSYFSLQFEWITSQYADPKKSGIFLPFLKFPLYIDQIREMTGGLELTFINETYRTLCTRLFTWLETINQGNEKYADASKIQNYYYFEESMKKRNMSIFDSFISHASQLKTEALNRYIKWMLEYEMPILMDIGTKVDLASSKIGRESGGLELYIKRPEALRIVKDIDMKKLEKSILTLYSRLEKHIDHPESKVLQLIPKIWSLLKSKVVMTLHKLKSSLNSSYQVALPVDHALISQYFDKVAK